jgi:hypothetical protein
LLWLIRQCRLKVLNRRISNCRIHRGKLYHLQTFNGVSNRYLGLFGSAVGQIKNLGLENLRITGASDKDTWVRLLHPPIKGRQESGFEGMNVGHELRVQLVRTNVELRYIDFKKVVQGEPMPLGSQK